MAAHEEKIRKLLALARQQDNPNEAATAFAHAQRLATLHGLDLDNIDEAGDGADDLPAQADENWRPDDIEELTLQRWGKAIAWRVRLATHLERANNCKGYYSSERLVSYGQPQDLHVVAVMYREISEAIERLARTALREYSGNGSRKSYGCSFRLGCVAAIGKRLRSPAHEVAELRAAEHIVANPHALARVETAVARVDAVAAAVDQYAKESLNLRSGRSFVAAGCGYEAGLRAGARVSLQKPAQGLT